MTLLKKILLFLLLLIALPFVVALFVPKQYTVSVSQTVNKPKKEVFEYLKLLKNQEQYSEWVLADPNLHPTITGTDGTVGAKQAWNSKLDDVGEGEQIITQISEDKILVDLNFKRPFEGKSKAATILKENSPTQTTITCEFYADEPYPLNLMSYFMGRPMIEKNEIKNLKNIKTILEK